MSKQHTTYAIAFAVVVLAILLAVPAQAQDSTLYLPLLQQVERRTWFTDAELQDAMQRYGYDPSVVAEHTWCALDASAAPPDDIRYAYCWQQYVDGQPTDGLPAVYYWKPMMAQVQAAVISGSAAQCDGEVTCE